MTYCTQIGLGHLATTNTANTVAVLRTFPAIVVRADRSLAEKPKVGELQMDWLRSEDLKEEKMITAPIGYCSSWTEARLIQIDH